jgi:hypothetical protein
MMEQVGKSSHCKLNTLLRATNRMFHVINNVTEDKINIKIDRSRAVSSCAKKNRYLGYNNSQHS